MSLVSSPRLTHGELGERERTSSSSSLPHTTQQHTTPLLAHLTPGPQHRCAHPQEPGHTLPPHVALVTEQCPTPKPGPQRPSRISDIAPQGG